MTGTTTAVHVDSDGYYKARIPKQLGDSLGVDGDTRLEWVVEGGDELRVLVR